MGGPLRNVRVLDLSTVGPGARAAALLADLGADVVKIGPPLDADRIVPAAWAYSAGRGTRRIVVDLKDPAGRDVVLRLAADADVLLEGFRPGVANRLGIGYEDVATVNPQIVYASLTGYGQDGPYADWAGHDLNYQAVAGALAAAGRRRDGGPALPGATFADSAGGGMHAALAVSAALVERGATGRGRHLDVAAVDGTLALMSLAVDEHLATGRTAAPDATLLHGRYACYDVYPCRDGKWLAVGAIEPKFWTNLCEALGLDEWIRHQHDVAAQDDIREALRTAFSRMDRDDWVVALGPKDTCVAPVLAVDEVPSDRHLRARGAFIDVTVDGETFPQTARLVAGADRPAHERGAAPTESDARAILADAGFDQDEIDKLLESEVVQ